MNARIPDFPKFDKFSDAISEADFLARTYQDIYRVEHDGSKFIVVPDYFKAIGTLIERVNYG